MAASSGVRCATFFDAASTFLNNDATAAEESAARPRLLPASEIKSRRVRTCVPSLRIRYQVTSPRDLPSAALLCNSYGEPRITAWQAGRRLPAAPCCGIGFLG